MLWALAGFSLVGVVLNVRRNRACFYVWAITNSAWVAVNISHGLPQRAALDAVYLGLALWGIRAWGRA